MSTTTTSTEKITSQISAQASAMKCRLNGSKSTGEFDFGLMALTIDTLTQNIVTQKFGDNFACERGTFADALIGRYWACIARYAAWADPTRWSVDFVDSDGSFGILFIGPFTCMVMARADGSVSGHS